MGTDAQAKIDAYLARLGQRLVGLPSGERRDIVEEIRSHIVERATDCGNLTSAGVDRALAALGEANELAGEYITEALLDRAETVRSPFAVLESLFRWASLSLVGVFVLLSSVVGYFFGSVFIITALMKPIHPHTAGLWVLPSNTGDLDLSLHLGFGNATASGREVLGWWIVPIGLLAGFALVSLTTRFALVCTRRYRRLRRARRMGA